MSDLMLKQFEAWSVIDNQYSISRTYTDLRYDEDDTEAAWYAWQASRECLVIELPDKWVDYTEVGYEHNAVIDQCAKALTAAGVKYT